MSFFKKIKEMFKKEAEPSKESTSEPFKKNFLAFQALLASNNAALAMMADMEEKLSGEYLFDKPYVQTGVSTISDNVKKLIDNLNIISGNKYIILNKQYDSIASEINTLLTKKREIQPDRYIIPLINITREASERVGSKIANLGEIQNLISLPVPDGFGISSYAYRRFMEHNGFLQKINERLSEISIDNIESLNSASKEIQFIIVNAEIPNDLEKEILDAYSKLCDAYGEKIMVAVRSSALQEDREFSFAGQYSTFLNVTADALLLRYKEVIASLFTQNALFYLKTKGFHEYDMVMPVGVLKMVDARAGGVMYSREPINPQKNTIVISAIRGLGKCVVDGTVTPETYYVSQDDGNTTIDKRLSKLNIMAVCKYDGVIIETEVEESMSGIPCLTDEEINVLSYYAQELEKHFNCPQDIEWAIDKNNKPYILQSKNLRTSASETAEPVPTSVDGHRILIGKGVIACKGIGFGKVHIVRTDDDLKDFAEGSILVAKHTSTKFVMVMNKTSAIITDVGAATGHMASLAREFQVPTILDTEIATELLANGQEITVDAFNCNVYEGRVEELMEFTGKRADPFKETQIYKLLQRVIKLIVPLNLADPNAPQFKPESCETFHDITRFCHEKAMHELFDIIGTSADDVGAIRFISNIPMEIWMLDLGEGAGQYEGFVKPENLLSVPFIAFFKGLSSMRWPQGQAVDVKGFIDSMIRTVTISEEELKKVGEKSFLIISKEYMNFAIRLGYHLSSVEAFVGENTNDNYIKFFFKGGGAVIDRRLRRVRLIKEILKAMDFDVKITGDVMNATLMKYRKDQMEKTLEVMGRLTVFTKQLDMVMYNDAITDFYIEDFCRAYIKK